MPRLSGPDQSMAWAGDRASDTAVFRLGYVPGVTPGKWLRIWAERLEVTIEWRGRGPSMGPRQREL